MFDDESVSINVGIISADAPKSQYMNLGNF